jgi:hypothetical protein
METEALALAQHQFHDPDLALFVEKIKKLAAASRRENNPIVL